MLKTTKVAIEAATKAGKLLSRLVKHPHTEKTKGHVADIVTESDIASNTLITKIIRKNFPSHAILSEETSEVTDPKKHRDLWIVDPIDGTISFAAGLPVYSVSISYCINQKLVSSALYIASHGEVLWTETGKGAFVKGRKLHVHDVPWENSVIALDQGVRVRKIIMGKLAPALSLDVRFLQMTAGEASNLGLVARGNIQGLICGRPNVWDYAAGIHLIQEAGGIVTDFAGNLYKLFSKSGHVAATPSILPHILKHTKKVANYFIEE